jgi:hypothetical protein
MAIGGPGQPLAFAISRILQTDRQFLAVTETPRDRSTLAASFDLPVPSGACR